MESAEVASSNYLEISKASCGSAYFLCPPPSEAPQDRSACQCAALYLGRPKVVATVSNATRRALGVASAI